MVVGGGKVAERKIEKLLIDRQTDPCGIKVVAVELKRIDLPEG